MGFLDSLFGKNKLAPKASSKTTLNKPEITVSMSSSQVSKPITSQKVQSLMLLYYAERFKVNETNYPGYISYEIGFPDEKYAKLQEQGYIRSASAAESLNKLKLPELKEIASSFGVKATGKKSDICERIEKDVSEEELEKLDLARYWKITEKGHELLKQNPYVEFCLEKHQYHLNSIGMDINTISKIFSKNPNGRLRDILWGEFNKRSMDYYNKGIFKGEFHDYCELLHIMALFVEEEGKHKDALYLYMRYLYYKLNFAGGLKALQFYTYVMKLDESVDMLCCEAEIYPFMVKEITEISKGCELDSKELRDYMQNVFIKEEDTGIFLSNELADLIMNGLNGENNKSLCNAVMRRAIKKLK